MRPYAHNNLQIELQNTACTIMKFSENVHIGPGKITINFGHDPW
jgi:hypothetical protein